MDKILDFGRKCSFFYFAKNFRANLFKFAKFCFFAEILYRYSCNSIGNGGGGSIFRAADFPPDYGEG